MKSSLSLFFEKIQLSYLFSRDKLSVVLHTSCACCQSPDSCGFVQCQVEGRLVNNLQSSVSCGHILPGQPIFTSRTKELTNYSLYRGKVLTIDAAPSTGRRFIQLSAFKPTLSTTRAKIISSNQKLWLHIQGSRQNSVHVRVQKAILQYGESAYYNHLLQLLKICTRNTLPLLYQYF